MQGAAVGTEIALSAIDREVLVIVLVAAGFGVIGGAAKVFRGFADKTPTWKQVLSSLLVGAIAAIAVFYVLEPDTALKFISACVISGYAGPALLDALEAKVKLFVAETKVARATDISERAIAVAEKAIRPVMPSLKPEDSAVDLKAALQGLRDELQILKQQPNR